MVRATSKNNANSNDKKPASGILDAIKAFSSFDFEIPTFKKKANSLTTLNKHTIARPLIRNGLKTINKLLKQRKSSNNKKGLLTLSDNIPFMNTLKNYTNEINKSTHLTTFKSRLIEYDIDEQNDNEKQIKPKNNKKAKRAQRRKQFSQQIKTVSQWKFDHKNDDKNGTKNNDKNNGKTDSKCKRIIETSKNNKKLIKCSKFNKRQVQKDEQNLTDLFKNDIFDLNPLKYTNNILKKKQISHKKLNGHSHGNGAMNGGHKNNKKLNGNIKRLNGKKLNGKKSILFGDNELKNEITKQLALMKSKSANKTKVKLNSKYKKKIKSKQKKNGKFIEKKMKQKMSKIAKSNQKKRRWRH